MEPAVVLFSGGLDSTTCLAIAAQEFEVHALTFDYGQRHVLEVYRSADIAQAMGIQQDTREIAIHAVGSAITDERVAVPKGGTEGIPNTYVPARNTILLAYALSYAEIIEAEDIFIGVSSVDYSGYPDCRPEFIDAFEKLANLATVAATEEGAKFTIHAPLVSLSKADTIRRGISLGVDYSRTWSCYDPQRSTVAPGRSDWSYEPCGACDSCLLREQAFKEVGMPDPALATADSPLG